MKNRYFLLLIILASFTAHAQNAVTFSVENYLSQVQQTNPEFESANLLSESSDELENQTQHIYVPSFFADYSHTYNKRPNNVPTFQGTKTVTNNTSLGVNQLMDFGLNTSLFYNMTSSTVSGANPSFYPFPHLNVHSLNLELRQPLLKNGFGKSTKATAEAKNATNHAENLQQQFSKKMILADAESKYWQLSVARAFVDVQQSSFERTGLFHKINTKRAKLNLIDNADLIASQAATQQRGLELKNAKDQEKMAARAFNELRGQNSDQVSDQLITPSPEMIKNLPEFSKQDLREDVAATQATIDSIRANAILEKDQRLPQLDVFGMFSTNGLNPDFWDSTSDTFGTDHPVATVGAQFNLPLDFKKNAKVRRAFDKKIKGAEKGYQQTLLQQETSWNSLNQQWQDAKARLDLALELKKTQTKKLEKERERQQHGRSTTYQVFLFEQDLLNVELLILQTEQLALNVYTQMKTYKK